MICEPIYFDSLNQTERYELSGALLDKSIEFTEFFFPIFEGSEFILGAHHKVITDALDRVFSGEITRLVINIPPGYTKTELAVVNLMARGLAVNPRCRFLHVSANDRLVGENSAKTKDIVEHAFYQSMWPMSVRYDTSGKHHWKTSEGGEVLAVSAAGAVIGFRAGRPDHSKENFTGAILIDDPIKPMDAYSPAIRNTINATINNSVMSRLMLETVPVIMIMQRVHELDATNYVLTGGTGDMWHWLNMPAHNETGRPPKKPKHYTHAIPIDYTVPAGALWPFKHTVEQLEMKKNAQSEEGESTGLYVFNAQYQQTPASAEDGMFRLGWMRKYDTIHATLENIKIYVDAAQETGLRNDWSVLMLAGRVLIEDKETGLITAKALLLDIERGKWKINELVTRTKAYWEKHESYRTGYTVNQGAEGINIENASNGTALIQILEDDEETNYHVKIINRSESKAVRGARTVEYLQRGEVLIPAVPTTFTSAQWTDDFLDEFKMFNELDTHPHDDQVDCMFDVVEDQLIGFMPNQGNFANTAPMGNA